MGRFPTAAFMTGNLALRLALVALRQNTEAVQGPETLTYRNLHLPPADPCGQTSERSKESMSSPTNSCQRFCVMDAPEIHQATGPVVVSEFLTAIQASDVGSSAIDSSAFGQVGRDGLAQGYRRTFMPMRTDKNKAKQRSQKERNREEHIPPWLRREARLFLFELTSRRRAIKNDGSCDPNCSGHFFVRLRSHVIASTGC